LTFIIDDKESSPGRVTVKYDGSTSIPKDLGTYDVTFDVAEATGWNAATNLSAGTLSIISDKSLSVTISVDGGGTAGVGKYLKADVMKTIAGEPTYQWLRNGSSVSGDDYWYEGNAYYYITPKDSGQEISVKVRCGEIVAESNRVKIPPFTYDLELKVRYDKHNRETYISAWAKIGDRTWNEYDGFDFEWYKGKSKTDVTDSQYYLSAGDKNNEIKVKISGYGESFESGKIAIAESNSNLVGNWTASSNTSYMLSFTPVYNIWIMEYYGYDWYAYYSGTYTVDGDNKIVLTEINDSNIKLELVIQDDNNIVLSDPGDSLPFTRQ